MAIVTDKQALALGGLVLGVGVLLYLKRQQLVQQASTFANAPLQLFRDPNADSSDIGTEAWARKQLTELKRWAGIETVPTRNAPGSPYGNNRVDPNDIVPDL